MDDVLQIRNVSSLLNARQQQFYDIISNVECPKEPHPWKRVEKALRKRKKIDDTTSEEDKRHLCALYNCMVRDLEEEGSVSE